MKKVSPLIILVKNILADVSPEQFDSKQIEEAARSILEGEGLVSPIIVRREGAEHYQLVEGEFEYCAAVRAREIDSLRGESTDAYVIDKNNEDVIQKQIALFRNQSRTAVVPESPVAVPTNVEMFERLLEKKLQPLMSELAVSANIERLLGDLLENQLLLTSKVISIEARLPLSGNNDQSPKEKNREVPKKEDKVVLPENLPPYLQNLNEASEEVVRTTITQSTQPKVASATKIVKLILGNRPFATEKALSDVKGMGPTTISKLRKLFENLDSPSETTTTQVTQPATKVKQKAPVKQSSKTTKTQTPKQTSKPTLISSSTTEPFLEAFNNQDKRNLFFKIKRATNLKDEVINQLIDGRPYQQLSDIKGITKAKLEQLKNITF